MGIGREIMERMKKEFVSVDKIPISSFIFS